MSENVIYAICAYRPWNLAKYADFPNLISKPEELEKLTGINPEWVFFLDWSWKVPLEIIKKYKCVCFHESDLPAFRGGSPIQNQILAGRKDTKLTAFLMDEGLDTGDILCQEDLSLRGHILEIMQRVVDLTPKMIEKILSGQCVHRKQEGQVSIYLRRRPEESEIRDFDWWDLDEIYDFIRMLEDPYPNAFIWVGNKKLVFKNAEFDGTKITTQVEIE